MTQRHERRDELIELISSGTTAYPGSEMGYLLDMLADDTGDTSVPSMAARTAWSWREMFTFGTVPRLT